MWLSTWGVQCTYMSVSQRYAFLWLQVLGIVPSTLKVPIDRYVLSSILYWACQQTK